MDPFSLYIYIALSTGIGSQFSYLNKVYGNVIVYVIRTTCRWQIAGIGPSTNLLKCQTYLEKHGETRRGHLMISLVAFFPTPPPHVKFVKLYNIEIFCTILGNYSLLFVTKLQRTEFILLYSNFLVPPLYPQKTLR